MRKRHARIMTMTLVAFVATIAFAQQDGVIRGRLIDGTDGQPRDGVTVTLEWEQDGETQTRAETTRGGGWYEFRELPVVLELTFTLRAEVDGEIVERDGVALSEWTPEMVYDLEILDTTDDATNLHARLSIVLPPSEASGGAVEVIEFLDIHNDGSASYTEQDHDGSPIGLHVHMPAGAQQMSIQGDEINTRQDPSGVSIVDPIKPGRTVVTFSYFMPTSGGLDLSRSMHVGLLEATILVGNPAWRVASPQFARGEPADIHGATYAAFTRANLPPFENIPIRFQPTSGASGSSLSPSGIPGSSGGVPYALAGLIGAIALATGGAIGAWAIQSRSKSPAHAAAPTASASDASLKQLGRKDLDTLKRLQLEYIAELDAQHEAKRLSNNGHRRLRDEAKARLAGIIEQLESN